MYDKKDRYTTCRKSMHTLTGLSILYDTGQVFSKHVLVIIHGSVCLKNVSYTNGVHILPNEFCVEQLKPSRSLVRRLSPLHAL